MSDTDNPEALGLTAQIAIVHSSSSQVPAGALPAKIQSVGGTRPPAYASYRSTLAKTLDVGRRR